MPTRLARLVAVALVVPVFAVVALAADRPSRSPEATPFIAAAGGNGSLSLSNSRGSGALLSVSGLAPGGSTQGQVLLANSGSLTGALTLRSAGTTEIPGRGGGRLSQRLVLEVVDLAGATIYRGPLNGLGTRSLGRLAPGAARRFRFTATLPNSGQPLGPAGGDNAYQGASLTTGFRWTATAPDPPGGGPADPAAPLVLRVALVKRQPALRRGRLVVRVLCSQECALSARATLAKRGGRSKAYRRAKLPANRRAKVTLRMSRRVARRVTRASSRRAGARLTLRVRARTADGRTATFARGARLRTSKRGGRRVWTAGWTRARR